MNARQTLASILAAAAMTLGAPLLASAQETPRAEVHAVRTEPMLPLDSAQTTRVRERMRGARAHQVLRASVSRDAHPILDQSRVARLRAALRSEARR